jgi:hypothetical protein
MNKNIIWIILLLIGFSAVGYFIFKFALGILVGLILTIGFLLGLGFGYVLWHKKNSN